MGAIQYVGQKIQSIWQDYEQAQIDYQQALCDIHQRKEQEIQADPGIEEIVKEPEIEGRREFLKKAAKAAGGIAAGAGIIALVGYLHMFDAKMRIKEGAYSQAYFKKIVQAEDKAKPKAGLKKELQKIIKQLEIK